MQLCIAGQIVLAQDFDGKLGIGANISYMGIADTGDVNSIEFDGTALIGANLTYYASGLST